MTGFWLKDARFRYGLITALIMLGGCGQSPVAKADDVDAEAEKKQISIKPPASQKPREIILIGEHRPRPWREQLPGLSVDKPDETAPPRPVAYRDGPAPVPEAAFTEDKGENDGEGDTDTKQSDTLVENKNMNATSLVVSGELTAEADPGKTTTQNSVSVSAGNGDAQREKSVTVQLGAFNSEEAAQKFIRLNHLAHLTIERQVLETADQSWHILTFGDFADKYSAGKAWLAATENAEEIEVWIRPVQP